LQESATNAPRAYSVRYAFRASLVGAAHQLELNDAGLGWKQTGKSGVWAYADIAAIRLSYRPVWMQARRFRADIRHDSGGRVTVLSTSWQTAALIAPQDQNYRDFIQELHARMARAGSHAALTGGLSRATYTAALALVALLGIAMTGLFVRAVVIREFAGALFIVGFAALFAWQVGGFIWRNRPLAYVFDRIPEKLLP
jgi:hypothetical protein